MLPIYYHRVGETDAFFTDTHDEPPIPTIGDALLWTDGRYRVVDRWLSFDHHGLFDDGFHVFVEQIESGGDDDRLKHLAPDYFTT